MGSGGRKTGKVDIKTIEQWKRKNVCLCVFSLEIIVFQSSVQFSQPCLTICDPMDCSTPGFPVLHHLPELAQAHVLWVCDAIQPSHPLLSLSTPSFNLAQHQGLFQWVHSSHQVAKVLEFQLHHQSIQWIFSTDSFRMDWLDLLAIQGTRKSLLQHTVQKHQFFVIQLSHPYMTTGKTIALPRRTFVDKVMSLIKGYPYINIEWSESCSVVSDSLQPRRLHSPWNSPGQNTGVGSLSLLQGIFPPQGSNPGLPHCRRILYQLSYQATALKFPSS